MNIDIQPQENKVYCTLNGRLDTLTSVQFARDIESLMDMADKEITLDCKELTFISSSGLRLFLSLRKKSIAMGGEVIITNVNEEVKYIFVITGFYSLFKFE